MDSAVTKRTFIPGSNWLYFKIYSGSTTATKLLTEVILPLCEGLLHESTIQQWFFIRYADPDPHLRLRFWCKDNSKIVQIITLFNRHLQFYVDQNLVWKIQLDTYKRELERYGINTMEASEKLFFYDSEMIANALNLADDKELKFLFVLKSIDQLLKDFGLTTNNKSQLVKNNGEAFKKEFFADKKLKKQLNQKYRDQRNQIESFLTLEQHETYQPLLDLIQKRSLRNQPEIEFIYNLQKNQQLQVSIENLLSSYIHMHVNRFFDSRQRLYEMVCYDFLDRYYRSVLGRENVNLKQSTH